MTGDDVRRLREALGLTQEELAQRLGLRHRSQVHYLESGRTQIVGAKKKILELLQMEADHRRSNSVDVDNGQQNK